MATAKHLTLSLPLFLRYPFPPSNMKLISTPPSSPPPPPSSTTALLPSATSSFTPNPPLFFPLSRLGSHRDPNRNNTDKLWSLLYSLSPSVHRILLSDPFPPTLTSLLEPSSSPPSLSLDLIAFIFTLSPPLLLLSLLSLLLYSLSAHFILISDLSL